MFLIAIAKVELPDELIKQHQLEIHTRGTNQELWFSQGSRLPVWHDGQLRIYPWAGNRRSPQRQKEQRSEYCQVENRQSENLSADNRYTKKFSQKNQGTPVDILASFARSGGYWYDVPQGIRGVLHRGRVSMLVTESTHYFKTMTRSTVEPVFIGAQI